MVARSDIEGLQSEDVRMHKLGIVSHDEQLGKASYVLILLLIISKESNTKTLDDEKLDNKPTGM